MRVKLIGIEPKNQYVKLVNIEYGNKPFTYTWNKLFHYNFDEFCKAKNIEIEEL